MLVLRVASHRSLASHIQTYQSHSSRILSVDLYFKGSVKLRIFVIYIPLTYDALRFQTIVHLTELLDDTRNQQFYHAICGDFNMHLDKYYPIFINQPQTASKSKYKLMYYLLSHNYEEYTPHNFSDHLGTYQQNDLVTRIDYIWSYPMLKGYNLTTLIFDVQDICTSDHNPVISY